MIKYMTFRRNGFTINKVCQIARNLHAWPAWEKWKPRAHLLTNYSVSHLVHAGEPILLHQSDRDRRFVAIVT